MNYYKHLLKLNFSDQSKTFKIALPIIMAQMIWAIGPFINTFLSAKLGHPQLAAQALVSMMFFTLGSFGWGTLAAVGILTAHHYGAKEHDNITQIVQQGFILALLLSIPACFLMWQGPAILSLLGQDPKLVQMSVPYFHALAWTMPAVYFGAVPAEFIIGTGRTRVLLWLSAAEIPINIFLKYSFMFGKFGFPKLGLSGLGWGITTICWMFSIIYLAYIVLQPEYRRYQFLRWQKQQWHHLREIFSVGWPIALTFIVEVAFFAVLTMLVGRIGADELAANQIAMQFLGFFSALLFAIGQATTSRAGQALGAKNASEASLASISGIQLSWYFVLFIALLFWFFPKLIISIDLNVNAPENATVVYYSILFLRLSAILTLFDSSRIVSAGILRAYKDTKFAMYASTAGFWVIGILACYLLSFVLHLGADGLWWGMIFGVASGAFMQLWRFFTKHFKY